MEKFAMLVDYKYCTGCHSCEIACRNEKKLPLEEWGVKITEFGPEKLAGKWSWNFIPMFSKCCDMCESRLEEGKKPSCAHHCLAKCLEAVPVAEISQAIEKYGKEVLVIIP